MTSYILVIMSVSQCIKRKADKNILSAHAYWCILISSVFFSCKCRHKDISVYMLVVSTGVSFIEECKWRNVLVKYLASQVFSTINLCITIRSTTQASHVMNYHSVDYSCMISSILFEEFLNKCEQTSCFILTKKNLLSYWQWDLMTPIRSLVNIKSAAMSTIRKKSMGYEGETNIA